MNVLYETFWSFISAVMRHDYRVALFDQIWSVILRNTRNMYV